MARPRKDQEGAAALERLEAAYWKLLEDTSQKPTVAAISRTAQVNHNTFYYYFDSIEDMAEKMFQRNMDYKLLSSLLPIIFSKSVTENTLLTIPNVQGKAQRMQLMARSPLTSERLRSYIVDMWGHALDIDISSLDATDRSKISFLSSGAVGILRDDATDIVETLPRLYSSALGAGIIQTLEELREKYGGGTSHESSPETRAAR